jgi:hypothetical protein
MVVVVMLMVIIVVLVVMYSFHPFSLQLVNTRRQQQAPKAVQKGYQSVLIGPDRRGAGALIWDALHVHVERSYVHTELT